MVGTKWRNLGSLAVEVDAPLVLAVLQDIVDDGVVRERQENVDAHGARYSQRIAVEDHRATANGVPRLLR